MKWQKIVFALLVFASPVLLSSSLSSNAQVAGQNQEDIWRSVLYAKNVDYGNFACDTKYKEEVNAFFKTRPLNTRLPICHNDCPIISCRPVIRFPAVAKAVRATGSVRVHVLVDEEGRVIYARVLDGNPLLREAAVTGACSTGFKAYPYGKHQGMMVFTVDNYDFLTVPFFANEFFE